MGYDAGKKIQGRKRHLLNKSTKNRKWLDYWYPRKRKCFGPLDHFRNYVDLFSGYARTHLGSGVHPATIQDRDGAQLVFERVRGGLLRRKKIWGYGGYAGALVEWVQSSLGWELEIVRRWAEAGGFEVLSRGWIVERTFGWLNRDCRLSKDYEFLPETSEGMIYVAMIHQMRKRLCPCKVI